MCVVETPICPDCDDLQPITGEVGRRSFLRTLGGTAAALTVAGGALPSQLGSAIAAEKAAEKVVKTKAAAKPAEAMIKELFTTLSAEQKKKLVLPWNDGVGKGGGVPTRHGMYNRPLRNQRIADNYTPAQQELLERTLKAICADDEGYRRISRDGKWDNSKSFDGCGAHIFGDPTGNNKFAWLFTGHHLTVRCDGNSEPGAAFGGPVYYGHLAHGYAGRNVFRFQTKAVETVFEALNEKQRKEAQITGSPGEHRKSIQFRGRGKARPGIAYADLSGDQKKVVETAMRTILSPFRKEDGDEAIAILKANGGIDKLHIAFYKDPDGDEFDKWHFWRLEGPGFVWNYRVLPHVHCYVNIAKLA